LWDSLRTSAKISARLGNSRRNHTTNKNFFQKCLFILSGAFFCGTVFERVLRFLLDWEIVFLKIFSYVKVLLIFSPNPLLALWCECIKRGIRLSLFDCLSYVQTFLF
jgi:hypothetical protein